MSSQVDGLNWRSCSRGEAPLVENAYFTRQPLYVQVRDALTTRIVTGKWRPGQPIANEFYLAQELGVTTGTMRRALEALEHERLIVRQNGRGTYVVDGHLSDRSIRFSNIRNKDGQRTKGEITSIEVSTDVATETECAKLQLRPAESVITIRRIRHHDNRPLMLERAAFPAKLYPHLPKQPADSNICAMAQRNGVLLSHSEEAVSIARASHAIAETLQVPALTPVLKLDRLMFTLEGVPAEWRVAFCHHDQTTYVSEIF